MVLYGITLTPLEEEIWAADPRLLYLFYAEDTAFDGSSRSSVHILKLLMERGPERGYFPKPTKSLFIADSPEQEEAAKREFVAEELELNLQVVVGTWGPISAHKKSWRRG